MVGNYRSVRNYEAKGKSTEIISENVERYAANLYVIKLP